MHSLSHLGEKKIGNIENSCCMGIFRKSLLYGHQKGKQKGLERRYAAKNRKTGLCSVQASQDGATEYWDDPIEETGDLGALLGSPNVDQNVIQNGSALPPTPCFFLWRP